VGLDVVLFYFLGPFNSAVGYGVISLTVKKSLPIYF